MRIHKYILKTLAFVIIFCLLWSTTFNILNVDSNSITEFYKEKENTIDIAYIGSSNVYMHFNSPLAFDKYGFTTGIFSIGSAPFMTTKYMINEVLKKQKPKLFVIDLSVVAVDSKVVFKENNVRNISNSFKQSKNRVNLLNEMLEKLEKDNVKIDQKYTYYFPFLLYHNSWKSLTQEKLTRSNNYFKGYYLSKEQIKIDKYSKPKWNSGTESLQEYNYEVLMNLLNYIKEKKLNVIFTFPPRNFDKLENRRINTVKSILEKNNYTFINFNEIEDVGIDFEEDLYDWGHLNVYGATKYTLYFSKYLKEHYDLEDHRNDKKYISWHNEYEKFKQKYKELLDKNFEDLLNTNKNANFK